MTDHMTFEDRARQAAAGLNQAVQSADLQLYSAGIPALRTQEPAGWRMRGSERWVAAAGAFAAILIVVGIAMLPGRLFAPDADVATPSPSVPDGAIVPAETFGNNDPVETTEGPAETTAPTEAAEDSSTTVAADTTPPDLTIETPEDGVTVKDYLMQFRGTTEPGATVIAAGEWDADVDDEGQWEIIMGLNSGTNIVSFTAIDEAGNETTEQITVIYDPPSPTTTTTKPEGEPGEGEGEGTNGEDDFTAFAQCEICEEDPPFNVYWGTAPAGSKVTVTSEYGEGQVYADEGGNWEIRVEFPDAPYNEEFGVVVKHVDTGETFEFGLVSLAG